MFDQRMRASVSQTKNPVSVGETGFWFCGWRMAVFSRTARQVHAHVRAALNTFPNKVYGSDFPFPKKIPTHTPSASK
jgi:hypothetical protein